MRQPYWCIAVVTIAALNWTPSRADEKIIEWPQTASLGDGWDILTGRLKPSCFEAIKPEDISEPNDAILSFWDWKEVKNQSEFREALNVDAKISYWGGTQAGAKATFARTRKIDRFSINYVARQINRKQPMLLHTKLLKPNARKALRDPVRFRQMCGTHYVKGEIRGGEYFALLSVEQLREEERQQIAAALSASGASFSGNVDAKSTIEQSNFSSRIIIVGGKSAGNEMISLTAESLRLDFASFRAQMKNLRNLRSIEAVMEPYAEINLADPRQGTLDYAAGLSTLYTDMEADLTFLERNPETFFVDQSSLRSNLPKIKERLTALRTALYEQMRQCSEATKDGAIKKFCNFSSYPAPPENRSDLPLRYRASCTERAITVPTLRTFTGFVRKFNDGSMGGGDVLDFKTRLVTKGNKVIELTLVARAYETSYTPPTEFGQSVEGLVVWDGANSGCYLKQPVALSEDYKNAIVSAPVGVHDYTRLFPASNIIADVFCRTNKNREDDGYVGCSEINLKPIPVVLEHVELENQNPPPFTWPAWLPQAQAASNL